MLSKLPRNGRSEVVLSHHGLGSFGRDPMSRWITALPLIAIGISIGDSGALGAAGAASYGVAGEVTSDTQSQSAQPQPAQWAPWRSPPEQSQPVQVQPEPVQVPAQLPRSIKAVRDKHHVAHHPKSPDSRAADSKAPPIKAPPPLPPALSTDAAASGKDEVVTTGGAEPVLKPRTVPTIRFLAPGAAPSQEPQAEVSSTQTTSAAAASVAAASGVAASGVAASAPAAPDAGAGSVSGNNASALLSALTRKYLDDKHDDTQESAAWWSVLPVPLTTTELLMLFGACGGIAFGLYGLVGLLRTRRQELPVEPARPLRRNYARQPPPGKEQYSARVERQRRWPHQFGPAIRNK
jgi:hypothetical protein